MNALVLYDSKFGNTERLARVIASELAFAGSVTICGSSDPITLEDIDLLVVGGPTHAHGISAPLRIALEGLPMLPLRGLPVATFDTRYRRARWLTGSAALRAARTLEKRDARLIVPPESFFIAGGEGPLEDGELERARDWARGIRERIGAATGMLIGVPVAAT